MPFSTIAGALPLLYQTEWCPSSRRVRQRLTELDVRFVAVPVPVERDERNELFVATGGGSVIGETYSLKVETALAFDEAVARVRKELETEGFGVLTEIDVQATLRKKLGVEVERYLILGACNPNLAHQALELEPELGVLLPCNVVVYERDDATFVSAVDAERMLSIVGNDELVPVATEVRDRLARVVGRVSQASG